MNNQKKLKKYTGSLLSSLSRYIKKGMNLSATVYPANDEGAIIEILIEESKKNEITIVDSVPRINDTLEKVDQRLIGGNIQGVTFRGTNLYMDGNRILIIKGEDAHNEWSNAAVSEDVKRIVSPKGGSDD
ncbi:hypothetical protein ACNSN2_07255 [Pseudoalteromonas sp. US3C1013]|uniref:hypothetical protein n=1 Tax=unclassified Pseudoalteromonas TaxID=194690 RepID=UPI003AB5429E